MFLRGRAALEAEIISLDQFKLVELKIDRVFELFLLTAYTLKVNP